MSRQYGISLVAQTASAISYSHHRAEGLLLELTKILGRQWSFCSGQASLAVEQLG